MSARVRIWLGYTLLRLVKLAGCDRAARRHGGGVGREREEAMDKTERMLGWMALAIYGASIVLANWMIRTVGTPIPGGSHLWPVGFGLMAPSGTYAAGVTFVARDVIQRTIGKRWSLVVILPGAALTALMDVHLAIASAAAFLFSESVDFFVYTPLRRRGFVRAVVASGLAAALVDSLLFLTLAGIPLAVAVPGLLLGKVWVMAVAALVAYAIRHRPRVSESRTAMSASYHGVSAEAFRDALAQIEAAPAACLVAGCDNPGTVWVERHGMAGGEVRLLLCERHAR